MVYIPEQGFEFKPDRLDREFEAIRTEIELIRSVMVSAMPWKGVVVEFNGVTGSDPILDKTYNVAEATRIGVGQYHIILERAQINGVNVADNIHPTYTPEILIANQPADTEIFFVEIAEVDEVAGEFHLHLFGAEVPSNNKLTLIPYDLQTGDRLFFFGLLSLADNVVELSGLSRGF